MHGQSRPAIRGSKTETFDRPWFSSGEDLISASAVPYRGTGLQKGVQLIFICGVTLSRGSLIVSVTTDNILRHMIHTFSTVGISVQSYTVER